MSLLCVGDLILDLAVTLSDDLVIGSDTAGRVAMSGGGSAANVAAWASRAGLSSRFVGAVGDDVIADVLTGGLGDDGVEVLPVRRPGMASRSTVAIIGPDGDRSLVSDLSTDMAVRLDDYRSEWLDGIDWLHLTGYSYIAHRSRSLFTHLIHEAVDRSIPYSIDPSASQLLRSECVLAEVLAAFAGAALIVPSKDEAEYLTGVDDPERAAEGLLDQADCVAVTCGPHGVYVARRGIATFHVEADVVDIVNTLGCGDAFAGGFIAGRLADLGDLSSARLGRDLATRATQLPSAR